MQHSRCIEGQDNVTVATTNGGMSLKGDIKSKKATRLDVSGHMDWKSGKKRIYQGGQNFTEEVDPSVISGDTVSTTVAGNLTREGTKTESENGTSIIVGQKTIEVPLMLEIKRHFCIHHGYRTESTFDPSVNVDVVKDGDLETLSGDTYQEVGSIKDAKHVLVTARNGGKIEAAKRYHSYYQYQRYKTGRWWNRKTVTRIEQGQREEAVKAILKAQEFTVVEAKDADFTFQGVDFNAPLTKIQLGKGKALFEQAKNESQTEIFKKATNLLWQSMSHDAYKTTTYTDNSTTGKVEVEASGVDVTRVGGAHYAGKDNGSHFDIHQIRKDIDRFKDHIILKGDGKINEKFVNEIFHHDHVSKSGPGILLSAVIGIAISYFTMGVGTQWGTALAQYCGQATAATAATTTAAATAGTCTTLGSFITGMTAGAFTTLCTTSALAILSCDGDLNNALKTICSSETLKSMVISGFVQGAASGFMNLNGIKLCAFERTFVQNVQVNAVRASSTLVVRTVFYGKDALKNIEKDVANVVIQSLCADICQRVGGMRGDLDYISHKLLHAGIGALGGLTDGEKGMASGAAGGVLGEIFAEAITDTKAVARDIQSKNPHLTANDAEAWHRLFYQSTEGQRTWSQFLAGLTTGMFGGNFSTAHHTATTATENNNALAGIFLLFEAGVITYDAYRAYRLGNAAYTLYNLAEKVQDKVKGYCRICEKLTQRLILR